MVVSVPEPGFRVRTPREGEIAGVVVASVGGGRFKVECSDKRERTCRVPGKLRRRVWVKDNDVVLIKPWPIQGESKGDIVWRYTRFQSDWLKRNGYLKEL